MFLSILIPTWNRRGQLEARIRAILPNLGEGMELVISDNGSTDGTGEMVQQTLRQHPTARIRYLRNAENLGVDANLRIVLQAGRGKWLWLVGDDDEMNFQLPSTLRPILETCARSVCFLQHAAGPAVQSLGVSGEQFLAGDESWSCGLLQIGQVICQRDLVAQIGDREWDRYAKDLHSHLAPYARGMMASGVLVITCHLYAHRSYSPPRWDLLAGYLGAWRSNLNAFPRHRALILRNERRLREKVVFDALLGRVLLGTAIASRDWRFVARVFSRRGKIKLLVLFAVGGMERDARRRWAPRIFPGSRDQVRSIFPSEAGPHSSARL
jgi:glycosyltransferase involved in cell wall biosynthesis